MGCLVKCKHADLDYRVMVEDDDRVAYAYIFQGKKIVGDVWLYNRIASPPEDEDWIDETGEPPLNAAPYVKSEDYEPISLASEVAVEWEGSGSRVDRAVLYVRDSVLAVLEPGAKPGWCANALTDGPLANVLDFDIE